MEQRIDTQRTDNVNGIIVGGTYTAWQLFYDGRPQSGKEYTDTNEEAMAAAQQKHAALLSEYAGFPCYLYPDPSMWEVRLWP